MELSGEKASIKLQRLSAEVFFIFPYFKNTIFGFAK